MNSERSTEANESGSDDLFKAAKVARLLEEPWSELFALPEMPKSGATEAGSELGTICGYGPHPDRIGIVSREFREVLPPQESRKGLWWWTVRYMFEETCDEQRNSFKVVCFACDSIWRGIWMERIEVTAQGARLPDKSFLFPGLEGDGLLSRPGERLIACPCVVGRLAWSHARVPFGDARRVRKNLELDAELAREGRRMIEANGGTVRGMLSKSMEKLEKSSRMPKDDGKYI